MEEKYILYRKADPKPHLVPIESVNALQDPRNMMIKSEIQYNLSPAHHQIQVKKEEPKIYYEDNSQTAKQATAIAYIPDTNAYQQKMSQYPKYQTPKLRAKSTYGPPTTTTIIKSTGDIYGATTKQEPEMMIGEMVTDQHYRNSNAVQVITPNANYNPQWTTEEMAHHTPDAIFIPSNSDGTSSLHGVIAEGSARAGTTAQIADASNFGGLNINSTINLIPVMTSNGLVLVAANNALVDESADTGQQQQQQQQQITQQAQQQQMTNSHANSLTITPVAQPKRRPRASKKNQQVAVDNAQMTLSHHSNTTMLHQNTAAATAQQEAVIQVPLDQAAMSGLSGFNNIVYTQDGPVMLVNEAGEPINVTRVPGHESVVEVAPKKGTVVAEPPKLNYIKRDINENTQYNGKRNNVASTSSVTSAAAPQIDAELDLDAAITVFKIYK